MKLKNASQSVIRIGGRVIKPGETVELSTEETKFSGVQALIKEGSLVEEKASKQAKKTRDKQAKPAENKAK